MRQKLALFFILCFVLSASAQERLTSSAMRAKGIQPGSFQPIAFSHDDQWLAAFDRASFEEKKAGTFYRIWFLKLGRDGSIGEIKKVPLPLRNLQQGEFTPDDRSFVVVGNRGTTFIRIDLPDLEVTTLQDPKWGKAGFRSDPAVLWTEGGVLYALGYPYDEARFVDPKTVATLGSEGEFEVGPNLTALEKSLDRLWFSNYLTPQSAFFGQKYPELTILSHWNGEQVFEFDRAPKFLGFWGNGGRLLYSARRSQELSELVLYDVESGEKSVLASQPEAYRYLFLSRDGTTALVSIAVPEGRLETYVAREENGWELQPLVADRQGRVKTLAAGWMRVSSSGKFVCHISSTGLSLHSAGKN